MCRQSVKTGYASTVGRDDEGRAGMPPNVLRGLGLEIAVELCDAAGKGLPVVTSSQRFDPKIRPQPAL